MIEYSIFTKDLLKKHLTEIINEVKGFEFSNWGEENFLRDMPEKWKLSIGVFSNGALAGFSFNSNKINIYYIHFFYIFKKYRNTGLGKSLLNICIDSSLQNNLKTIQLMCHKDNAGALGFYLKNSFHIKSISENDINLYLMEKNLT
jgi:ribosomal protein S18 acetylase RimI-like enzyme